VTPVPNPTYMGDIRHFFRPMDVSHMASKSIQLGTYDGVRSHAVMIYFETLGPDPMMPPDTAGQWDADKSETFKNWMRNGYPLGTATAPADTTPSAPGAPARVRKDVTALDDHELGALAAAFEGLMARDWTADDGYFALAGIHGLPNQYCLHHEDPFNPWHRVFLQEFEDALRAVPGCADVTLPYWDFLTPLPAVLQQAPFASYAPPPASNIGFTTTQRYTPAQITANLQANGVPDDVEWSLKQSRWGAFNTSGYQNFSIQAHDGGHDGIGPTMANQDWASFDPVFWFFHCNIDRLWLSWQTAVDGTTLPGFITTLDGDTDWLSPPINVMQPWTTTSTESITFDIGYDKLAPVPTEPSALENKVGSLDATRSFRIRRSDPVSVRVKGIDRLNIPGTFRVVLLADGKPIARRAFFQPTSPRQCETCAKRARVNIDFRLDQAEITDRALSVEIHVSGQEEMGTKFPLAQAGNPTINVRLLLEDT
jgi:tyrosinase